MSERLTDAERRQELEYKLLYAIVVAGKSARFAEQAMWRLRSELLRHAGETDLWIPAIRRAGDCGLLKTCVMRARVGNYGKVETAFWQIAMTVIDLETCTAEELEHIHGVGQKTSRFFLRWTGRRERFAVLDVHILRWLGERGHNVPRQTPQSRREYERVEELFLHEADRLGEHPCDLDQRLWLERNTSGIRE